MIYNDFNEKEINNLSLQNFGTVYDNFKKTIITFSEFCVFNSVSGL